MNLLYKKIITIIMSFLMMAHSFAIKQIKDDELGTINVPDNCEIVSAKGGTTIAYLNGITNTLQDAQSNLARLREQYGKEYQGMKLRYQNLYNQTDGFMSDLSEVFKQKIRENSNLKDRWPLFFRGLAGSLNAQELKTFEDAYGKNLVDSIKNTKFNFITNWLANWETNDEVDELLNGSSKYGTPGLIPHMKDMLSQKSNRVLIVAHSQGNLFVNPLIGSLTGEEAVRVGTVHVANTASLMHGNYVTAGIDHVVNNLRLFFKDVPLANTMYNSNIPGVNSFLIFEDLKGHSFIDVYYNPNLAAKALIDGHIKPILSGSSAFMATQPETQLITSDMHALQITWEDNGVNKDYITNISGIPGGLSERDVNYFSQNYAGKNYHVRMNISCDKLTFKTKYPVSYKRNDNISTKIFDATLEGDNKFRTIKLGIGLKSDLNIFDKSNDSLVSDGFDSGINPSTKNRVNYDGLMTEYFLNETLFATTINHMYSSTDCINSESAQKEKYSTFSNNWNKNLLEASSTLLSDGTKYCSSIKEGGGGGEE